MPTYLQLLEQIRKDPAASIWLKFAIVRLGERDPVDALRDARELVHLCEQRCAELGLPVSSSVAEVA